jgi:hypothetical protein
LHKITVVLQDENGNEVTQGVDVPTNVLARPDDPRFTCLRFVDPYGDTVFNRLQVGPLLEDLHLIRDSSEMHQYEAAIRKIEELIERCQKEPHLYIRFVGD